MFSLDLVLRDTDFSKVHDTDPKHTEFFATRVSLWKLLSPIAGHLTWDFPVLHPSRSNTVLILAIPPDMSPDSLAAYVRAISPGEFKFTIINSHIRSVILEFTTQEGADVFYINSLGEPFENKMRHLRCISLFLARVSPDSVGVAPVCTWEEEKLKPEIELPMCPICFFRFDPLISTLFSFASVEDVGSDAFREWGSPACPACTANTEKCSSCDVHEKLWVCLECGHVGCGRDQNQHAVSHFESTKHRFALRFEDRWLWDYVADRSVDRTFHDRPSEATDEVVTNYRKLLLQRIADQRDEEVAEISAMQTELEAEIERLQKELEAAELEEAELRKQVDEFTPVQKDLEKVEAEIEKIRGCPEFTQQHELKIIHNRLTDQLATLEKRREIAYQRLTERPDVDNVIIDPH